MTLDNFLIDKRVVQRNIERGKVDAADYAELLRALPDRSGNVYRHPEVHEAAPPAAVAPPISDPAASSVRTEPGVGPAAQPWMPGTV